MDSRVTFLVGPTFFHTITLARPAGSTWSRRDNQSASAVLDNQSMRECCWLGQKVGKEVDIFFSYTAISRKVVGKTVHVTIPKGNMGYDQCTFPDTVAVESTFVTFL